MWTNKNKKQGLLLPLISLTAFSAPITWLNVTHDAGTCRNSRRIAHHRELTHKYENEETFVLYQIITSLHENLISLLRCREKNKYSSIFVIGSLWI